MGEDVVAEKQVGGLPSATSSLRGLHTEELDDTGNLLLLPRHFGDVGRRLDAENRNTFGLEVLEQIAIVARNLDDLARCD